MKCRERANDSTIRRVIVDWIEGISQGGREESGECQLALPFFKASNVRLGKEVHNRELAFNEMM